MDRVNKLPGQFADSTAMTPLPVTEVLGLKVTMSRLTMFVGFLAVDNKAVDVFLGTAFFVMHVGIVSPRRRRITMTLGKTNCILQNAPIVQCSETAAATQDHHVTDVMLSSVAR